MTRQSIYSLTLCVIAALAGPAAGQEIVVFEGKAAYYSPDYKGKVSAGVPYDPAKFTAAHKTLPFGTKLKVTDIKTGRSVTVEVNDRGPFSPNLDIDLSLAAARALDMVKRGVIRVRVTRAE